LNAFGWKGAEPRVLAHVSTICRARQTEEAVKETELSGRCHQRQLKNIKILLRRDLRNDCGDRHAGSESEGEGHTYENLLHDSSSIRCVSG
jgi:hypothetical protein